MSEIVNVDDLFDILSSYDGFSCFDKSVTRPALQSIRNEFEASSDPSDRYRAICEQISATENVEWRCVLMRLRDEFESQTLKATINHIEQELRRSPERGWSAWMKALAEAISLFNLHYSARLCEYEFLIDESHKADMMEIRNAVRRMCQSRWEETYRQIELLSGLESLLALSRARLAVLKGQIQLWRLKNPDQARVLFEEAEEMAPNDGVLLAAYGDYWLDKGDLEKAKGYYWRAVEIAPKIANGYVGMGDLSELNNQLEYAESWYREAISKAGGDSFGYDRLLRLLGRPTNLKNREKEFLAILEKRHSMDPDGEYDLYLDVGKYYLDSERFLEAREWYYKAIALQESWPSAYIENANLSLLRGDYREAEEFGTKAIERSEIEERRAQYFLETIGDDYYKKCEDRESTKRVYGKILEALGEQYRGSYHNRLGNMYYYFDEYDAAAEEYLQAIEATPRDPVFHRNLSGAYKYLEDYENAALELERAYAIDNDKTQFDQKKASLANRQGNTAYEQLRYDEAIKHYTEARELDPSETVYETNLAGAWLQQKEPGKRVHALDQAIHCYERAQEIAPMQEHAEQIAKLSRRREIARAYGEKALDLFNIVTPVAVEVAKDLIPYIEGNTPNSLSEELLSNVNSVRTHILERFGLKVPGIRFRGNETDLPDGTYIVMIKEIPLVSGSLSIERRFCTASAEKLSNTGVTGTPGTDPVTGEDGCWVDSNDWEKVKSIQSEKADLWGLTQYLMRHVEAVLGRNLGDFLGPQEIVNLLESDSAKPFEEILASSKMVIALTTVCRALVAEEVPIIPFQELCTTFKDLHSDGVGLREIVENIRCLPAFRERLPGNDGQHSLIGLSENFESEIRRSLYEREGYLILAMEPERCQNALTAVRNEITDGSFALVVDDPLLRPFVRKLVELEFPDLHVLSKAELPTDAQFAQGASIDLDNAPADRPLEFRSLYRTDAAAVNQGESQQYTAPALEDIRVEVFVSPDFDAEWSATDNKPMSEMFSMMQDGLFYELGIIVPEVQLQIDENLKFNEFKIRLNTIKHGPFMGLGYDEFLVNDTVDRLKLLNIEGRTAVNPANGSECAIVHDTQGQVETCEQAGLTTWDSRGYVVLRLSSEIRRTAAQFQTEEITQYNFDMLGEAFPALVRFAVEQYPLPKISQLLRELLDEEISIRDLNSILESLLSIAATTDVDLNRFIVFLAYTDGLCPSVASRNLSDLMAAQLADYVRMALRRYISNKYTRGGNTLVVFLIEPAIEQRIGEIGERPLTKEEEERLLSAIHAEVGSPLSFAASNPVLLTTFEVRRALRGIIKQEFPNLAVVSYQELSPDMNIQPLARIYWK